MVGSAIDALSRHAIAVIREPGSERPPTTETYDSYISKHYIDQLPEDRRYFFDSSSTDPPQSLAVELTCFA